MPTTPPTMARTASTISGRVMDEGDSCRWCLVCSSARHSPVKVMKTCLNM